MSNRKENYLEGAPDEIFEQALKEYCYAMSERDRPVNLTGLNLTGLNLRGIKLHCANLRNADLTDTILERAHLRDADLTGANLTRANLHGASMYFANLDDANLTGTMLRGAAMYGISLTATPDNTTLHGAILSHPVGIQNVVVEVGTPLIVNGGSFLRYIEGVMSDSPSRESFQKLGGLLSLMGEHKDVKIGTDEEFDAVLDALVELRSARCENEEDAV